jgi:hypothetical protein
LGLAQLLVEQSKPAIRRFAVAGADGKQLGGKGVEPHATHGFVDY